MDDASRWCAGRLMIVILIALYLKVCQLRCYLLVRFTVGGDLRTKAYARTRMYVRKYMIQREREEEREAGCREFDDYQIPAGIIVYFRYIAYDTAERGATVSLVDICIVGEISLADHRGNGFRGVVSSNLIRLSLGRRHRDSIRKLSRFCQLCLREA